MRFPGIPSAQFDGPVVSRRHCYAMVVAVVNGATLGSHLVEDFRSLFFVFGYLLSRELRENFTRGNEIPPGGTGRREEYCSIVVCLTDLCSWQLEYFSLISIMVQI